MDFCIQLVGHSVSLHGRHFHDRLIVAAAKHALFVLCAVAYTLDDPPSEKIKAPAATLVTSKLPTFVDEPSNRARGNG